MKTKSFNELRNRMTPQRRAQNENRAKFESLYLTLNQLQKRMTDEERIESETHGELASMHLTLSELRQQMTPEQIAESETRAQLASLYLTLVELQKLLGNTDDDMAKNIDTFESAVSQLEEQDDIEISTLSRYIQTLGGSLKLVANFPDKEIILAQFE